MEDIKVSIFCAAFNHEKYIEKCLNSFINQKTNFKYEVLINEDCSTDKTADIIRAYAKKYPTLIKPIFQNSNQYSKGVSITNDILFPLARGRYIAICEGDDYWCDENKLQVQFDYMESHKECSMCTHNTIIHDLSGKKKDTYFNKKKHDGFLTAEEIFLGWTIHTSSYFIKKEYFKLPVKIAKYWFGDYVRLTYSYTKGKIGYISTAMSVYNNNNSNGATKKYLESQLKKKINMTLARAEYLKILKENFGCDSPLIDKRIRLIEYDVFRIERGMDIRASNSIKESIKFARNITRHPYFKEYMLSIGLNKKIKTLIKYRGYYIYPLWIKLWRENKFN